MRMRNGFHRLSRDFERGYRLLSTYRREFIEKNWKDLQDTWDRKYPSNPISSQEEDDDEDKDS